MCFQQALRGLHPRHFVEGWKPGEAKMPALLSRWFSQLPVWLDMDSFPGGLWSFMKSWWFLWLEILWEFWKLSPYSESIPDDRCISYQNYVFFIKYTGWACPETSCFPCEQLWHSLSQQNEVAVICNMCIDVSSCKSHTFLITWQHDTVFQP